MENMNIPDKINMYNVYKDGTKLIGMGDETPLPNFEALSDTLSGAGLLGEIDSPSIGLFTNMELQIPFRSICGDFFSLADPTMVANLTLRGSHQMMEGQGNAAFVGLRVVVRGRIKSFSPGTVKQGAGTGASVTINLSYIMIELDGVKKVELDKLNGVYVVNNVDVLKKARALC